MVNINYVIYISQSQLVLAKQMKIELQVERLYFYTVSNLVEIRNAGSRNKLIGNKNLLSRIKAM